jgi:hypothetical protein
MVQVLSPDGITIEFDAFDYPNMKEANKAFARWKKRYERQGYYSSSSGRIPLNQLKANCTFIKTEE